MQHNSSIHNDNNATLAAYQAKTQEYINNTPLGDSNLQQWLDEVLRLLPRDGTIFEIGSGLGRDAEYFRRKGFSVVCSEAVANFLKIVKSKGFKTYRLNILTENIQGNYDLIFANAVIPHFTPEETGFVLGKIHEALKEGGYFAFSLKKGSGAIWSDEKLGEPRYFHYWQPDSIKALARQYGFEWVNMSECYTAYNDLHWMLIILRRSNEM